MDLIVIKQPKWMDWRCLCVIVKIGGKVYVDRVYWRYEPDGQIGIQNRGSAGSLNMVRERSDAESILFSMTGIRGLV